MMATFTPGWEKLYMGHYGYMGMVGNATATSATAATPLKIAGTTTPGANNSGFVHSSGRLTFLPDDGVTRDFQVNWCLSQTCDTNATSVEYFIAKNGVPIAASEVDDHFKVGADHQPCSGFYSVQLASGDYIEIWLEADKTSSNSVDELHVSLQRNYE